MSSTSFEGELDGHSLRSTTPGLDATSPPIAALEYIPSEAVLRVKRVMDLSLALLLIPITLPLIAVCIVAVRISSPGPGLYRQVRLGRGGRPFIMYKIRSMRNDSEAKTGAVWCQPRDPRITRLGMFLRKSHLDELPQLFNVLRGEMSLVGPRPERPEIVEQIAPKIAGYRARMAVPPGITGLAQISLPPDVELDDVRRKLIYDLHYIERIGLTHDLKLIVATLLGICKIDESRIRRWLGLTVPDLPDHLRRRPAAGQQVHASN